MKVSTNKQRERQNYSKKQWHRNRGFRQYSEPGTKLLGAPSEATKNLGKKIIGLLLKN